MDALTGYLEEQPFEWEVLVVDDGSTDATAEVAASTAGSDRRMRVESVPHWGKGWAVRTGMLAARGRFRLMFDADMAMPATQIGGFLARMEEGWDIVIGSREASGAKRSGESAARHFRGRVFNRVVSLLAVSGYRDTQCGFKCFEAQAAETLFSIQRANGFGFDVEVLFLAQRLGMRIKDIPIDWYYHEGSKVKPVRDSFLMLRDILSVRWSNARGRYGNLSSKTGPSQPVAKEADKASNKLDGLS